MHEMIAYIFGSLRTSENAVKHIRKTLAAQERINQGVATFTMLMAIYAVLQEINLRKQSSKIEKLSKELEELKRSEGE